MYALCIILITNETTNKITSFLFLFVLNKLYLSHNIYKVCVEKTQNNGRYYVVCIIMILFYDHKNFFNDIFLLAIISVMP